MQQPSGTVRGAKADDLAATRSMQFPQFDVSSDCSDHHYVKRKPSIRAGNAVSRRVMSEWSILRSSLPEAIYVRVYEERIDLLRAVIVGTPGTPYHDGLFFFDFAFPQDYPNSPPLAHYRSFGICLNPNLYDSGKVCLNLLNTWLGPGWEPDRSTMLQLLVSLQGLVLNEEPFFNEPIFSGWTGRWARRQSRSYNNNAFLKSCETMMLLLQNPPRNFEGFVADHFRRHGRAILTACKAYAEGLLQVGQYKDGRPFLSERVGVSWLFKYSMHTQYPMLVEAFAENDPSLMEFAAELDKMIKESKNECILKEKATKNDGREERTCFGMLKKIFGLLKAKHD